MILGPLAFNSVSLAFNFLPFTLLKPIVVQLTSCVRLFAPPWNAARQASLSFTVSQSFLKLMSIESVMPSNRLILCRPLFLLPSIFPSIRDFSSESALHIKRPMYWSFSFSISLSSEYSGLKPIKRDINKHICNTGNNLNKQHIH